MSFNKKVIITGATGLIGKESIQPLKEAGFDIFALARETKNIDCDVNWINCDLFDSQNLKKVFQDVKPTHLLNFAWATTDDYLTSNVNFDFLKAGLDLLKYFKENNGKKAVFAGTCFEYEFKDSPIKEDDPVNPQTTYAKCKNHLRELAEIYCKQNNISFGWGRVFYAYGVGENIKRLTPHTINNLKNNKEVTINSGNLIRDYVFSKDIAGAFVKFLDSGIDGIVNIGTGKGISLADFTTIIAEKLNKKSFLKILNEPTNQPVSIVCDNTKLKESVGYKIKFNHEEALNNVLTNFIHK